MAAPLTEETEEKPVKEKFQKKKRELEARACRGVSFLSFLS